MQEDDQVHVVRRRGVVVALLALLVVAGVSCGGETTPEGMIAFSHGVGDDIVVLSLVDGGIRGVTSARGGQFRSETGRPTAHSWSFATPAPASTETTRFM